jgi:hypothetical protein
MRLRFTVRGIMIAAAFTAIWLYIIAQGIAYQARHLTDRGAWGRGVP